MKQTLQLKTAQQLTLTPQLQQSIKLLQLSTMELQTEVERYLLENPMLERADEPVAESPADETEGTPDEPQQAEPHAAELEDWKPALASTDGAFDPMLNVPCQPTLREALLAQLSEVSLVIRDHAIVQLLIEELDDDGYLPTPLEELRHSLPAELALGLDELQIGLRLLQQFDPPGIGARNLSESLLLQLERLPETTPALALARKIVSEHLSLLGNRDYNRLKKLCRINDETLRTAQTLITSLNPRPATLIDEHDTHYITPDIAVRKKKDRWVAELNRSAVPMLRVNQLYARMMAQDSHGSTALSGHLQEARWLVKNIQQRFDTILKVSEAIVERQQDFFELGEVGMRPMILRDIADELGLHESTVSRVTTQKYLLCARGLFELKYFFGSSLETDNGQDCSATAIKAHIRRLVEAEPATAPLSDSALADALARQGIQVARRTVAKYRESMQIAPVNQRKVL